MRDEVELATRRAIRRVRGRPIEHVIVLDCEGVELWRGTGDRTKVARPRQEWSGCVLVHNHPSGGSFSGQDVADAINAGLREVIAVAEDHTYRLRLPPGGVHSVPQRLREVVNEVSRADSGLPHHEWERLFKLWPGCRYRRLRNSEAGADFIARPSGPAEEAL